MTCNHRVLPTAKPHRQLLPDEVRLPARLIKNCLINGTALSHESLEIIGIISPAHPERSYPKPRMLHRLGADSRCAIQGASGNTTPSTACHEETYSNSLMGMAKGGRAHHLQRLLAPRDDAAHTFLIRPPAPSLHTVTKTCRNTTTPVVWLRHPPSFPPTDHQLRQAVTMDRRQQPAVPHHLLHERLATIPSRYPQYTTIANFHADARRALLLLANDAVRHIHRRAELEVDHPSPTQPNMIQPLLSLATYIRKLATPFQLFLNYLCANDSRLPRVHSDPPSKIGWICAGAGPTEGTITKPNEIKYFESLYEWFHSEMEFVDALILHAETVAEAMMHPSHACDGTRSQACTELTTARDLKTLRDSMYGGGFVDVSQPAPGALPNSDDQSTSQQIGDVRTSATPLKPQPILNQITLVGILPAVRLPPPALAGAPLATPPAPRQQVSHTHLFLFICAPLTNLSTQAQAPCPTSCSCDPPCDTIRVPSRRRRHLRDPPSIAKTSWRANVAKIFPFVALGFTCLSYYLALHGNRRHPPSSFRRGRPLRYLPCLVREPPNTKSSVHSNPPNFHAVQQVVPFSSRWILSHVPPSCPATIGRPCCHYGYIMPLTPLRNTLARKSQHFKCSSRAPDPLASRPSLSRTPRKCRALSRTRHRVPFPLTLLKFLIVLNVISFAAAKPQDRQTGPLTACPILLDPSRLPPFPSPTFAIIHQEQHSRCSTSPEQPGGASINLSPHATRPAAYLLHATSTMAPNGDLTDSRPLRVPGETLTILDVDSLQLKVSNEGLDAAPHPPRTGSTD